MSSDPRSVSVADLKFSKMKRYGNLYPQLCSFENLWLAAKKAEKGKRSRPEVARFNLRLESELFELQQQLRQQSYQPGIYRQFVLLS